MGKDTENSRPQHVRIISQMPIQQVNQAIGYDPVQWEKKVNAVRYYPEQVSVDPHLSRRINQENYIRSSTYLNGTNGNYYIWDNLVELANLPTSGDPTKVQQQYVQVPITNADKMKTALAIRNGKYVKPTANGKLVVTDVDNKPVVESISTTAWNSAVNQARSGNTFFQWIVNALVGKAQGKNQ